MRFLLSTSGTSVILTRLQQPISLIQPAVFACLLFACLLSVQNNLDAAPEYTDSNLRKALAELPVAESNVPAASDYLINAEPFVASVTRSEDGRELILSNG